MSRGRRMALTEEDFQVWLEKNRERPLSDEVERLQDELRRLETMHTADISRLQKAASEWRGLMRKGFLVCLGLVALLLWYMNSYSETRAALEEVCAFIAPKVSAKIKEDAGETLAEDLKGVNNACNEKFALGSR
jgi:hypothetical protein